MEDQNRSIHHSQTASLTVGFSPDTVLGFPVWCVCRVPGSDMVGLKLPSSTFRGVRHVLRKGIKGVPKWEAVISKSGKQVHLGMFASDIEAAKAYDREAQRWHATPILNFLPDGSLNKDRKKLMGPVDRRNPAPTSNFRGVRWHDKVHKWEAVIKHEGRVKSLGYFDEAGDAAKAYDRAVLELRSSPVLNFLPDGTLNPFRKQLVGSVRIVKGTSSESDGAGNDGQPGDSETDVQGPRACGDSSKSSSSSTCDNKTEGMPIVVKGHDAA